jgi:hypothetical protein
MKQIASNGINPVLLGVPERWTDTAPTINKMPERFNAGNIKVWILCVQATDARLDPHEQWSKAVQMYVRLCVKRSLDPFTTELDRADNEAIRSYLKMARLNLVKWLDRTHLLELLYLNKVWHEIELRDQGFVVHVYARCEPQCKLDELQYFLRRTCKFHIATGNGGKTWQGYPRPDILFDAKLVNGQHVRLHYAITVTRQVFNEHLEKGDHVSVNDLRNWILKTLWLPSARGFRPVHTLRKTSF